MSPQRGGPPRGGPPRGPPAGVKTGPNAQQHRPQVQHTETEHKPCCGLASIVATEISEVLIAVVILRIILIHSACIPQELRPSTTPTHTRLMSLAPAISVRQLLCCELLPGVHWCGRTIRSGTTPSGIMLTCCCGVVGICISREPMMRTAPPYPTSQAQRSGRRSRLNCHETPLSRTDSRPIAKSISRPTTSPCVAVPNGEGYSTCRACCCSRVNSLRASQRRHRSRRRLPHWEPMRFQPTYDVASS